MSIPRPTLTIASIGVAATPIQVTIASPLMPENRENGGDLQTGDRWFDTTRSTEWIYVDGDWKQITHITLNN